MSLVVLEPPPLGLVVEEQVPMSQMVLGVYSLAWWLKDKYP